jgi:hypothetical protein
LSSLSGKEDPLFSALREAWDRVEAGADLDFVAEAFDRALAALQDRLAQELEPGPGRADFEAALSNACGELEERARLCLRDDAADPRQQARRGALIRAQSRVLRRATRWAAERPDADEVRFLLLELEALEQRFENTPLEDRAGAGADLERLRESVVRRHVEDLIDRSDRALGKDAEAAGRLSAAEAEVLQRIAREMEASLGELRRERDEARRRDRSASFRDEIAGLETRVREAQERVDESLAAFLSAPRGREDLSAADRMASRLAGELDEARLGAFDLGRSADPRRLHRLSEQGRAMARRLKPAVLLGRKLDREIPPPSAVKSSPLANPEDAEAAAESVEETRHGETLRAQSRRLIRMSRRLGDLADDRVLGERLEKFFGAKNLRRWDTFIFWLIVILLVTIVVNYYRDPDPEAIDQGLGVDWAFWVDTIICSILLWDFGFRCLLHPSKGRFFLRHFLTDFLPSLPVGLLVILHHGVPGYRLFLVAPRVLRVLRFLQPLVRVGRLVLFSARALDRLVERNAWFLNRNIVFFTQDERDAGEHVLTKRMRDLDGWIRRDGDALFEDLSEEDAAELARWRARFIEDSVARELRFGVFAPRGGTRGPTGRDLDVDEVCRSLRAVDGRSVAALIGTDFAERVSASLRVFRLPGLRRLPVVRFVLDPSGAPDPLETTARLAHVLGDGLALGQRAINWFADLHGTITGAQFLDRLGMQLVKATVRPAKRVALALVVVGTLWLFVSIVDTRDQFAGLTQAARNFVTIPLLLVGLACSIPLVLGVWFRRIAGQAVDFYDRVAEAQFLALTEIEKEKSAPRDLAFLAERVLVPEIRLRHDPGSETEKLLRRSVLSGPDGLRELMSETREGLDASVCQTMLLFYREFLDGAYFHRNDTKIANLLVGNLTLENVRRHRLAFDKKRKKRLDRLDIGRGRGGVTGPFVWFNFITHSVAQQTARLVIEYNQHAIPREEQEDAAREDKDLQSEWLERRLRLSAARRRGGPVKGASRAEIVGGSSRGTLSFRSTYFNSLHFLTADRERDAEVRVRYGDRIVEMMIEDREHLVRTVFGTFPMQDLPLEKRIFNPYRFYRRYAARGRLFLAPFYLIYLGWRLLRLGCRKIVAIIRDVIDPDARPVDARAGRADFDVARRKIHRMRRPVVMETLRLRAELDLEYLGLSLPGRSDIELPEDLLVEDLEFLDASEREWEEFRDLKSRGQHRLRLLSRLIRERVGSEVDLEDWLISRHPGVARHPGESVRALATAFICDQGGVATLLESRRRLRRFALRLPEDAAAPGKFSVARLRQRSLAERWRKVEALLGEAGAATPAAREETGAFEIPDEARRTRIVDALLLDRSGLEEDLDRLVKAAEASEDPFGAALESLLRAALQPAVWTEQIAAVRTLQGLGILDLRGYESLIRELGRFGNE